MITVRQVQVANELVEKFKGAILSNTVIRIRDKESGELLWSCHDGKFHGWLKEVANRVEVEQDLNLILALEELEEYDG